MDFWEQNLKMKKKGINVFVVLEVVQNEERWKNCKTKTLTSLPLEGSCHPRPVFPEHAAKLDPYTKRGPSR